MKLNDKISSLELEEEIKLIYINAGFETVGDLLKESFEKLSLVGSKNKYKFFRTLLRFMHDRTIKFDFEKDNSFKQRIIDEEIEIAKLDFSTYLVSVLEKYKINNSKTLYELINNDFYQVYKVARNEIKSELSYTGCRGLKSVFDIIDDDFYKCEEKYQEERNLYLVFLNEYIYLESYFENNDISIDKLNLSSETKNILKSKNIDSLSKILYDFNINVIKDIKFNGDSFNYKYYKVYDYRVIEDIISLIRCIVIELYGNKEYINLKNKINNSSLKNINIEELNLSEDIIYNLKLVGVNKLEDILIKSKIEIVSLLNIGKKGYEKIIYAIAETILVLKDDIDNNKLCKIIEVLDSYFEFKKIEDKINLDTNKLVLKNKNS